MSKLFIFLAFIAYAYCQSVVDQQLFVNSHVKPSSRLLVSLQATISGLPVNTSIVASFLPNDAETSSDWKLADLLLISRTSNNFVFAKNISSPARTALYKNMRWVIKRLDNNVLLNDGVVATVEVTCSDQLYCNGEERYIRGSCAASNVLPCVDPSGDLCSSYHCIESNKSCSRTPIAGSSCQRCLAQSCKPDCKNKLCGFDGCGGSCGGCSTGLSCVDGACQLISQSGTCPNPAPLFALNGTTVPASGLQTIIFGDNSIGSLDLAQPVCQGPGIPEYVYSFVIPSTMGVEIRMTAASGDASELDTLLAIHDSICQPFSLTPADVLCSDDQTPPGGYGSRVTALLPPGTYTLIVTAYATSSLGPYRLQIKFVPNCKPLCEGKFCGQDNCGGSCGECGVAGTQCNPLSGRCQAVPCTPNCKSRKCGDDGCGGSCGFCKDGKECELREGICVPTKSCNSLRPQCASNRQGLGPDVYCGTDCQWYRSRDLLPDLIPNSAEEVKASTFYEWIDVPASSCALAEGCFGGTGRRLIMRFDTSVDNIGLIDLDMPDITRTPGLFEWATCHQHFHFQNFARFRLYYPNNTLAVPGAKLSYCMEDSALIQSGSQTPCDPVYTCDSQGIARGRRDIYASSLDCQWLDITTATRNCWYEYEVCTNIGRSFMEYSFDNNCVKFSMYIADVPDDNQRYSYDQLLLANNADSFYPGCKA